MNKKNLSVVMAGAMLATSVAPVLADTTTETKKDYEVNNSNRGLFIKEARELIESKYFANEKVNNETLASSEAPAKQQLAGKSVHYVKVNSAVVIETVKVEFKGNSSKPADQTAFSNELTNARNLLIAKYGFSLDSNGELNDSTNSTNIYKVEEIKGTSTYDDREFKVSIKANSVFDESNISALETAIQYAGKDTEFEVWDRGYEEKDGKYYAGSLEEKEVPVKFTAKELENEADTFNANKYPAVYKMEYNEKTETLTVYTRVAKTEDEAGRVVKTYTTNDNKVDFNQPIDSNGNVLANNFSNINPEKPFKEVAKKTIKENQNLDNNLLYTVTVTDVTQNYNVVLSDLYDGLFLTDKGQELIDTMEKYDNTANYKLEAVKGNSTISNMNIDKNAIDTEASGIYSLTLRFTKPVAGGEDEVQEVKITTNDLEKLQIFADGLKATTTKNSMQNKTVIVRNFPVEVLAGDNRYETAVKVAKENADIRTVATDGNIVLVNGNSLVDGLAAAPLAASVVNGTSLNQRGKDYAAPILLTDANGLPKATKDYMKEIIGQQQVGNLDKVTVYLVGGTSVISKSVENELKDLGLRVVRAGGEDREATSLAVAELMEKETEETLNAPFVVGANGEADAMSIAGVAAQNGRPIIVESVHGIKEDTINYLKGYKNTGLNSKDVTIIGGETVVSSATEKELKDADLSVERVAGSNRQATNALVLRKYYSNASVERFIVSKDGINNKSELIDALTATSLSVKEEAPIVLGTNKLSSDQISQIEAKSVTKGVYVYQVGIGVARDVVQTIANRVGLAK